MTNPIDNNAFDNAYTLTKYNYGVTDNGYSASDAALMAGITAGGYSIFKGGQWAWKNRHDYKTGWQNVKNDYNNAKYLKGSNLKESYLNNYRANYIADLGKRYPAAKTLTAAEQAKLSPAKLAAYNKQQAISAEYNHVRQLIKDSKGLTGKALLDKQKEINQALADAKLSIAKAKATPGSPLAPTSKLGKAGQWLKNKTGITKAELGIKTAASNGSKWARMLTKAPKGTPLTTLVALGLEAPTIVDTYKKLGAGAGTKQLAKSTAIAGAGVLGYAAGAAAMGAAVGSVVPIAGTAVGAVVGLVGGLLGAWGADTLARKLLPSELEITAKKEAEEASKNPEKMQELLKKTEETTANETNKTKLEELQKAYDALTEQTAGTLPNTGSPVGTVPGTQLQGADGATQVSDTTNNQTSKLKKAYKKLQEFFSSAWNFNNPQDLYNSLKPYEKPVYQISSPYGMMA